MARELTQSQKAKKFESLDRRFQRQKQEERNMASALSTLGGGAVLVTVHTALTTKFPRAAAITADGKGDTGGILGAIFGIAGVAGSGRGGDFALGGGIGLLSVWWAKTLGGMAFLQP